MTHTHTHTYIQTQATLCSATSSCEYQIVESIPDQVNLPLQPLTTTTFESWKELIGSAQKSIKIAGFYFTLDDQTGQPDEAKAQQGREIYKMLESAKKDRGINVQIVQNKPSQEFPNVDTERLREVGVDVVDLDWSHALNDGVMHSKFIIVDDASFYLGSANMDWRALTQVKELGVMVRNCSCLTRDLTQIFNIYQYVGRQLNSNLVNNSGFRGYPQKFETLINQYNRLNVNLRAANIKLNDLDTHSAATAEDGAMFFSSSPAKINTDKRTNDVDALVGTINNATEIVNISVMDMIPMKWYGEDRFWWDQIDSALRTAVLRNVTVNLLVSKWNSTTPAQLVALDTYRTFSAFCGALPVNRRFCTGQINVKVFEVPDPVGYPPAEFTRVNHAKYMVTDSQVYITTNNWTWDYFYNTAGVSIISTHESLRSTVKAIFERDWNSEYAHDLSDYLKEKS